MWKFLGNVIRNNTGVSSKNFFLVSVTAIGLLLLIIPAAVLIVEIVFNHTIRTDLNGMAAYIGAVAGLFATAGITKAWSEKYERKGGSRSKRKSGAGDKEDSGGKGSEKPAS